MIKKFTDFLGEHDYTIENDAVDINEAANPSLRKSLDELGAGLKTDEDIVKAIEAAGFRRLPTTGKERSADYAFEDPSGKDEDKKYISYTNGYVRAVWTGKGWFSRGTTHMTPITRDMLPNSRDRLLLILRRAIKISNWSGKVLKDAKKDIIDKRIAKSVAAEKEPVKPNDSAKGEKAGGDLPAPAKSKIGATVSAELLASIRAEVKAEEKSLGESVSAVKTVIESEMKKYEDPSEFITRVYEMLDNLKK
jgi:hypothetical protein